MLNLSASGSADRHTVLNQVRRPRSQFSPAALFSPYFFACGTTMYFLPATLFYMKIFVWNVEFDGAPTKKILSTPLTTRIIAGQRRFRAVGQREIRLPWAFVGSDRRLERLVIATVSRGVARGWEGAVAPTPPKCHKNFKNFNCPRRIL